MQNCLYGCLKLVTEVDMRAAGNGFLKPSEIQDPKVNYINSSLHVKLKRV